MGEVPGWASRDARYAPVLKQREGEVYAALNAIREKFLRRVFGKPVFDAFDAIACLGVAEAQLDEKLGVRVSWKRASSGSLASGLQQLVRHLDLEIPRQGRLQSTSCRFGWSIEPERSTIPNGREGPNLLRG